LRILAGALLVLAGLSYYLGITIGSFAPLLFVMAGAAVVLLALVGHKPHPGDISLFVISLLVLAAFVSPGAGIGPQVARHITHSASKA
jgi:hypothetical protein